MEQNQASGFIMLLAIRELRIFYFKSVALFSFLPSLRSFVSLLVLVSPVLRSDFSSQHPQSWIHATFLGSNGKPQPHQNAAFQKRETIGTVVSAWARAWAGGNLVLAEDCVYFVFKIPTVCTSYSLI